MRLLTAERDCGVAVAADKRPRSRRPATDPRLVRCAVAGGVLLAMVGFGVAAHRLGWDTVAANEISSRSLALTARAGLAIRDIEVEGRGRTAPDSILAALGAARGAAILAVSPSLAKARLEALPWVESASVERRLPDMLYVRITERQPLALWQHGGKLDLVDRTGHILPVARLDEFAGLVELVGDDAPQQGAALLAILATEPDLAPHVSAAVRIGGRRWNLHLDSGIDVEMPEQNPLAAWHQLAQLDRDQGLLKRAIARVDLRLSDRLVLQTLPDPAKAASAKKKPAGGKST